MKSGLFPRGPALRVVSIDHNMYGTPDGAAQAEARIRLGSARVACGSEVPSVSRRPEVSGVTKDTICDGYVLINLVNKSRLSGELKVD